MFDRTVSENKKTSCSQSYQFDENLQSTVLDQSTGQILTTTENALSLTSSLHGINHTETSIPNQQQINNQNNLPSWIVHNCEATLQMDWCPKPLIGHLQKICDNKWQFAPVKDRVENEQQTLIAA